MTRILTNDEIEAHLSIEHVLADLETMFEEMAAGRAITSSREDILSPVPEPPAGSTSPVYHGLKSMNGSIPAFGVGTVRINSDVINWPAKGGGERVREKIPAADGRYTGLVLVFDLDTGAPRAIFPDGVVQSYRVGATSALGAKYLAREDASRLGMLGAGWQAKAHLLALDAVFDLDAVEVYSPTPESREAFAEEMADRVSPTVEAASDPETVVKGADVVQCTTNATTPVFSRDWLEPGTHVGVIRNYEAPDDFFEPEWFDAFAQSWTAITQLEELGDQLNERPIRTKNINNYVIEGEEPVPKFAGATDEPLCDWAQVPGLSDVIADPGLGRSSPEGITGFFNEGMGIQFAAVGKRLCDLAEAEDLGRELPTELFTQEYHP